jgi:pyruvate kinase
VRRTKIVATLGPATTTDEVLGAMMDAGMDVARLGLAHGTADSHLARIQQVRRVARQRKRIVGVLADLPGPKVRAGEFPDGGVFLAEGAEIEIASGAGPSSTRRILVDEERLDDVCAPGDKIVMGDGTVTLEATAVRSGVITAVVRSGGRLQGSPGVHLPSDRWQPLVPTDEDIELIDAVARHADWVAVSFIRGPDEMVKVREILGPNGPKLVAKIETRSAVDNLEPILAVSDGVMVARGDLGIDCPIEQVPYLQKQIIAGSVAHGLPVITATQMLESMTVAPTPTRAEASDVANAVYDGTSALMLSGETAIGHDPVQAVATMASIAEHTEVSAFDRDPGGPGRHHPTPVPAHKSPAAVTVAMTRAAARAAAELDVDAIICCSRQGRTVRAMAALRPDNRIIGASPSERTARQLALSWGVEPLVVGEYRSTDDLVWCVIESTVNQGLIQHGDTVAILAGAPSSATNTTDVLRIVDVS